MFLECSAKTKQNIQNAFEEICLQVLQTENLVINTTPGKIIS
jgi:GTPase SAR1 family protein